MSLPRLSYKTDGEDQREACPFPLGQDTCLLLLPHSASLIPTKNWQKGKAKASRGRPELPTESMIIATGLPQE